MPIIKTPDQRVRVFISSTINELADERKSARTAISNLRLIPVFFEAGARPHPPRDLYSAYLEQSHIFLGIYWNSYGWVAPGAEISGLEDEYRLCGNSKPKLIYVKRSNDRQPKLKELLLNIQESDTACYQAFSDAEELQRLIENDLSVLMSEMFENALAGKRTTSQAPAAPEMALHKKQIDLPLIRSEIYGRDEDLQKIAQLITQENVNLLTLLGPGGAGKSTLAIHAAHRVKDHFRDGAVFVPLAPVTDPSLVASTIAEALDVQDTGKQSTETTLIEYLSDKNFLLILDNFEQVVECAQFISDLVTHCQDLTLVVTSRTSLHIRHERIYNLGPLALPGDDQLLGLEELRKFSATELFVERALEVNPNLDFNKENTEAVIEICQRMDGLPLAIELAAARAKFFQPAALLSRIAKTLDLVSRGHKDRPERQQTLRGAIEWSYNLMAEDTQKVFRQLGIFKRSWTLEAADAILNQADGGFIDIEEYTERLLDVSLIKPVLVNHSAEPRFNMLQTVHEYALEMLEASPDAAATKLRYADYFLQLCKGSEGQFWGINSDAWQEIIEAEYHNIRAAFYIFIENQDFESAWKLIALMSPYWAICGGLSETMQWQQAARMTDSALWQSETISPEVRGQALTWAASNFLLLADLEQGFPMLEEARQILSQTSDEDTLGLAMTLTGCFGGYIGMPNSGENIEEGYKLGEKAGNRFTMCMNLCWSSEYYRQQGQLDLVVKNLKKAHQIALEGNVVYMLGTIDSLLGYGIELLKGNPDYEELAGRALNTYHQIPEKGYKSVKASLMLTIAFARMMQGDTDGAEAPLMKGLEFSRAAAETEYELYGATAACEFFRRRGDYEKAYKLFGAAEAFFTNTGYPIGAGMEIQVENFFSPLRPNLDKPQHRRWYEEGRKMSMPEAVVFAMH